MFEIDYRTPEIKQRALDGMDLVLTADIPAPIKLFQGQSKAIATGVAIKSDQHVFAVPLRELNEIGLVMGSGIELLDTAEGDKIELTVWNRNQQGTPRMIEILPGMAIAQLSVMPKYCHDAETVQAEKKPAAASKTGTGKRGPKPKAAAAETGVKTGTDG